MLKHSGNLSNCKRLDSSFSKAPLEHALHHTDEVVDQKTGRRLGKTHQLFDEFGPTKYEKPTARWDLGKLGSMVEPIERVVGEYKTYVELVTGWCMADVCRYHF